MRVLRDMGAGWTIERQDEGEGVEDKLVLPMMMTRAVECCSSIKDGD